MSLPDQMTPAIEDALGLPNFHTGPIAHLFRALGHDIPTKCEAEQAFVLWWTLRLALEHGDGWRAEGIRQLDEMRAAAGVKTDAGVPDPRVSAARFAAMPKERGGTR